MKGRIKDGWYRDPSSDPDYVVRIRKIAGGWISTLYSRSLNRPCACGGSVTPMEWARLEPVAESGIVETPITDGS